MVDIRELVVNTLNKTGYPVYFEYPEDFSKFPMCSYWDSGHESDNYFDGKATTDDVEITIDVWEKEDSATGQFIEIHWNVDKLMRQAGFRRTMYVPQFEEDTKVYHYTFKFKKIEEESNE